MNGKILPSFLTGVLLCIVQVSGFLNTYRGAVVEYHPEILLTEAETISKNVENYKNFIAMAKSKKAEIIVFPELGLGTRTIASPVPDPVDEVIPCDDSSFETTQTVKDLSCASKTNKIYSVVNLLEKRKCAADDRDCPKRGYYLYNTNVVFDRRGAVIARYAKTNLFDESGTNSPKDPELIFFDTDFGVRFGTFICFDILFQTPALRLVQQYQITDFIFTSYWFSELPFLTALQVQRGWAESNNVNLLASGVDFLKTGSGGSGIYNGKFGELVKIFPESTTSKLLIADIPRIGNSCYVDVCKRNTSEVFVRSKPTFEESLQKTKNSEEINFLKDNIYLFKTEVIQTYVPFEQTICSARNFCCDFNVLVDSLKDEAKNYTYRAIVFNGVRYFGKIFRGGVQACGIIACNGPELSNCTNRVEKIPGLFYFRDIRIKGNFKSRNSLQIPSTLTDGDHVEPLSVNKYEFTTTKKDGSNEVYMELLWPVTNLHAFGIWGRDFSRDNEPELPISGSSLLATIPCLLVSLLGFVLFAR